MLATVLVAAAGDYDPSTAIVAGFTPFVGYIPAVVAVGLTITLALWGTRKLISFAKGIAK